MLLCQSALLLQPPFQCTHKTHAIVVGTQQHADVGRLLVISSTDYHRQSNEVITKLKLSKPVRALYPLDSSRLVVSVDYQLLVYILYRSTLTRTHWLSTSRTVTALHCHDGAFSSEECTNSVYAIMSSAIITQGLWQHATGGPSTCTQQQIKVWCTCHACLLPNARRQVASCPTTNVASLAWLVPSTVWKATS